ncbi:MAG TPA: Gfo/Idh/MocA family oxidoreductase, partial [Pirellulales bacterium]
MSELSRRQFLHDSMIVAAAAGAAGMGSKVLGAEKTSTSIEQRGPNEKLRFAVVGVNGQGNSHIGNLLNRMNSGEADIVAICDVDETIGKQRCSEIKAKAGVEPKFYQDLRKLFEDKDVDCISAAVPNHWHALLAIWGMQAGKDVYIEKPASHDINEGQRMVETARKHNRICQVGTQSRSMPGTIEAINYIKAGNIGDVNLARGLCYKPRGSIGPAGAYDVPSTIDYNIWCGPAPLTEKSPYKGDRSHRMAPHYDWHWFWNFGNGDMGNQGIHEMDVARWGLGVNELAHGVLAYGGRFGYEDAGETPNTINVVLDYGPKSLVFETRGLKFKPYKGVNIGILFEGTNGYVAMTSYTNGAAFDKDGKEIKRFSGGEYPLHHAAFIKAVRSRKKEDLTCDIQEGHLSAGLVHIGNIS